MSTTLSKDHLRSIAYFWLEKGDPIRYCAWDEILPLLERDEPAFMQAWRNYLAADKTLNLVARDMMDRGWEDET